MFVSFVVQQLAQREQSRPRPSPSNRPSIGQWPVLLSIKYFDACSQPRVCDSFIQLVSLMNQPKTYTYSYAYTQHNWYTFSTHLYWLSVLSQWLPGLALVCIHRHRMNDSRILCSSVFLNKRIHFQFASVVSIAFSFLHSLKLGSYKVLLRCVRCATWF